MSGYRDVRVTTSTVGSVGGGSAWGSGVFRNNVLDDNSQENVRFVDDHDRRPDEKSGFNIQKVSIISCSLLIIVTIAMVSINLFIPGNTSNSTNLTNSTQLLSV